MSEYTLYDTTTGKIKWHRKAKNPEAALDGIDDCDAVIEGHWDGNLYTVIAGVPTLPPQAELDASALVEAKENAKRVIADAMASKRGEYITSLPGQETIYQIKETEAISYLAKDPEPATLVDYPFLAKEVGVTADTPANLAQLWLNLAALWRSTAAELEGIRQAAKSEVESATTVAEVDAAVSSFETNISAI